MEFATRKTYDRPNLPDGKYTAEILQVDLGKSKSSGKLRIRIQLRYLDGPCKGADDWKVSMLTTDLSRAMFKEEMQRLGLVVGSSAQLREVEAQLYSMNIHVLVSTTPDGRRIELLGIAECKTVSQAFESLEW